MFKRVKECPACHGTGWFEHEDDGPFGDNTTVKRYRCAACNGLGKIKKDSK